MAFIWTKSILFGGFRLQTTYRSQDLHRIDKYERNCIVFSHYTLSSLSQRYAISSIIFYEILLTIFICYVVLLFLNVYTEPLLVLSVTIFFSSLFFNACGKACVVLCSLCCPPPPLCKKKKVSSLLQFVRQLRCLQLVTSFVTIYLGVSWIIFWKINTPVFTYCVVCIRFPHASYLKTA